MNASDVPAPRTIEREHWTLMEAGPGRLTVRLHSFAHFETYVRTLDIFAREMVWRGHASPDWPLNSSLDRLRARCGWTLDEKFTRAHLDRFKEAARGRFERGITPSDEDGWWAIGRHFGLATPLLDWTRSPFIAAYFAYCEEPPMTQHYRCVYGLSTMWVNGLKNGGTDVEAAVGGPVLHMVSPFSQDNTRLIAQDALFSRAPDGQSIEDYVGARAAKETRQVYLLRIEMPDAERLQALQHLRLMNISHRTLFPDLSGAAVTTNLDYELGPFAEAGRFSSQHPLTRDNGSIPSTLPPREPPRRGVADPLRSTFRTADPTPVVGSSIAIGGVVRDAYGDPVVGAMVKLKTELVNMMIPNPFASAP